MGKRTEYQPGTFCWPELVTSDTEAAKTFYCELMGWNFNDMPLEHGGTYTMWQFKGEDIGATYQMMEEQKQQGVPPHWLNYVSVENVDRSVDKAKALGAQCLTGPFDIGESGRMALIQDPQGAIFGLWQPINHIGAKIVNEEGALCWNELATKDVEAAKAFYGELFGWGAETSDSGMGPYTSFKNGEAMAGGMLQMTEEWGDIPPHWMTYFHLKNIDQQCERVKSMGGTVCVEPFDIPDIGRFAVINDPQGAVLSIIDLIAPDP